MNKDKIVVYSNYLIIICAIITCIILGFVKSFSLSYYYITIAFICGISLTNLIFMIIRLSVNKDYNFKKFTPALHSSYLIIAVLAYYLIKNLNHFDKFWYLYWILLIGVSLVLVIVFSTLNFRDKTDNKPKIVVNRR